MSALRLSSRALRLQLAITAVGTGVAGIATTRQPTLAVVAVAADAVSSLLRSSGRTSRRLPSSS